LGLLPGAGGTQRLPRLIGAGPALAMMLLGKPVSAKLAQASGLIDVLVEGDVVAAALDLAVTTELPLRQTGALPSPPILAQAVAEARAGLRPGLSHAPATIIDCVEQITPISPQALPMKPEPLPPCWSARPPARCAMPFSVNVRWPASPACRAIYLALHRTVGVIGGGTMGTGIAIALLNAGLTVTMVELQERWPARATPSARRWPAMSTRAASPPMRPTP
jgi:3-hydroxyacyl-CoA dehydrogenase